MKNVYIVSADRYRDSYCIAFENRNDAVKTACAIFECGADEAAEFIKTLPYVCDKPQTVNIADLDTIIDTTLKAAHLAFTAPAGEQQW